tara:strand:- start:663 stop:1271 length:609 start_codon:yes stop_codon:yes gene_type:complete
MINLPLNFSAPTGQAQNTYAQPTRTNPYLTSSQYSDMQQHTPSGYYYQGGKFYEPYTVGTKQVQTSSGNSYNPFGASFGNSGGGGIGSNVSFGNSGYGYNAFGGYRQPTYATVPDILEGSVQSGDQYFKPFAGNAQGIINGNLSMAAMSGQNTYQPQGIPSNFLSFLSAPNMQPINNQQSSGASRFAGLLGSPIVTTNTQGK